MSGILSYVPIVNRLTGSGSKSRAIDLPSVEIHPIETNANRRARCLKHLLKANHVNYSIVYHDLRFNNHNAHVLSSAYLLGASEDQLHEIYAAEIQELEPWTASPAELIDEDWRDFLGDKLYQRAYVDYFEDKLAIEYSYDWKKEMTDYLFSGEQPLFHGLIGGLGHPLIHLGYAYEMESKELGMEALGLACVQYNFLAKYSDEASYTKPSLLSASSPLDVLLKLSADDRFNDLPDDLDFSSLERLFDTHEALIMEYWNGWKIDDPLKQFELSQEAAVALLVATVRPGTHAYDFFVAHLLTTSHAVRILLPFFPPEHHITLVREWWLLVIGAFIIKKRPAPDPDNVESDLKGKHWTYVEDKALNSVWSKDSHYVKGKLLASTLTWPQLTIAAIRAMKEAARTWGDVHEQYLRAAVTFVDNFRGWKF